MEESHPLQPNLALRRRLPQGPASCCVCVF